MSTSVDLDLEGMTCASCAARIEKKLNALPGVEANVNFATHSVRLDLPRGVSVEDCVAAVEKAGYGAVEHQAETEHQHDDPTLLRRLIVAAVLAIPVIVLSMAMPMPHSAALMWTIAALSTPVVVWSAWPFHRAAFNAARHGSTTMDTLVSLGVLAAFTWSVVALFTGGHIYFEVAVTVTTFLLAGRYAEARAKKRAGEAVTALLKLGAKEATVLRDGQEVSIPIGQLVVGDEFVVRPGERIATDAVVVAGDSSVDNALITGESVPVEVGPGDRVIGAAVNQTGRLIARAERVGKDTELAQIAGRAGRHMRDGTFGVTSRVDAFDDELIRALETHQFQPTLFEAFLTESLRHVTHIQPVTVIYDAPPGADPRFYGWWGDMDFGPHLLRVLAARRGGAVRVICHPPLRVAEFTDRKALARHAEAAVRAGMPPARQSAR